MTLLLLQQVNRLNSEDAHGHTPSPTQKTRKTGSLRGRAGNASKGQDEPDDSNNGEEGRINQATRTGGGKRERERERDELNDSWWMKEGRGRRGTNKN